MALGADDYLAKPFDQAELLSAIAGRLARFQHLKPNYDLQAGEACARLLDDAQAVGKLESLSLDRKVHVIRKKIGRLPGGRGSHAGILREVGPGENHENHENHRRR